MKKFLFLVVAIAALGACNDDLTESAAPGFRFEQPEVSSIKSTAVVVSCRAPRGGALLEALESGFVCTPGSGGAGDSFVTTDCEVSGDLLSARLTGLLPGHTYRVYAFLVISQNERITGPEVEFVTAASGDGDGDDDQVREILLDGTGDWPQNSYAAATCRFGGYDFSMESVGDFGNGIQLKSGAGWIANKDDMGIIRRIELVYATRTTEKNRNICLYLGDAPRPDSNRQEASEENGTYVFDCAAAGNYRYFKLLNGTGVSYLTSITIYCGGPGGENPGPGPDPGPGGDAEPVFATPSFSGVTKNGASVSCAYTWTGEQPVTAVRFVYKASSGAEQFVDAVSTTSPANGVLEGLTPSTLYSFALCLEIDGQSYRSAWTSFMTRSESGEVTTTRYAGWPELPIEVENSDYYYANHICPDFKVAGHAARNFTVCYSAQHHCPVWVAAPLHDCYVGGNGNRSYGRDPVIPANIQPASKSVASPYNKGHLLGNRERSGTSGMNKQVSYYTNMAPQHGSTFNTGGGAWNNLENYIDGLWCKDTLYMVSGCHFDRWTDSYGHTASPRTVEFGSVQAGVPTMFYYVLLRTRKGNSGKSVIECSADELQCVGFVMSHAMEKGHKPSRQDMRSVAELEEFTGFKFFTNVPNAPKYDYNPADWGL